jgi:hypothetical protein
MWQGGYWNAYGDQTTIFGWVEWDIENLGFGIWASGFLIFDVTKIRGADKSADTT